MTYDRAQTRVASTPNAVSNRDKPHFCKQSHTNDHSCTCTRMHTVIHPTVVSDRFLPKPQDWCLFNIVNQPINQSTNQPLSRPHTHKDKEPPKTQRTSKSQSMPSFRFFERVKAWKALDHSHRIVGLVPPQKNGAHRIKYPQRHLWAGFLLIGIPVFNSR